MKYNRNQTIEERMAELTPEEREQHKELIAESLQRQKEVRANTAASYKSLEEIQKSFAQLAEYIRKAGLGVITLAEQNQKLTGLAAELLLERKGTKPGNS